MKVVVKHLQRDKKTGLLSYRRRFPTELIPYIPSESSAGKGRTELKCSLRSANMSDPIARTRYAEAEGQFQEIVSRAQRVASRTCDKLDSSLIQYLAQKYAHDHLQADEAMRWKRPQLPALYETNGHPEELYEESRALLDSYDQEGLNALWGPWALSYSEALGHYLDPADQELPSLCRALAEAACDVWRAVDKRIDDQSIATPPAPERIRSSKSKSASPGQAQSLIELYEQYAAVPDRSPKTIAQWRTYILCLVDFLGTDDVCAVTHDSLVAWIAHLEAQVHKGKPLAPKTINGSYMGSVCALFAWARAKSLVTSNPTLEVGKLNVHSLRRPVPRPSQPRRRSRC